MTYKQIVFLGLVCVSAGQATTTEAGMRSSANRAVQVIEKSMGALAPNIPCASCHHNNMPLWALSIARDHGVQVNSELYRNVAIRSYGFLQNVDRAIQGTNFVDPGFEAGELLGFATVVGVKPSLTTALEARRNATLQREDGHWATLDSRPPLSSSQFTATALNIKVLSDHMPANLSKERDARIAKARKWLLENDPVSVEDSAFRLLGLHWSGANRAELESASKVLLNQQCADGSWAQVAGRTSDAYGTGEALAALKITGTISNSAYQRGVAWLLSHQLEDGSWLVKTRLHEVAPISPPYMETGFPHGKNQIVSMVGTTWSALALALGLPEKRQSPLNLQEVRPPDAAWIETAAFGTVRQLQTLDPTLQTPAGSSLLMVVANDPLKVRALLDRGVAANARSRSGHTAATVAATYKGASPVLRQLIEHGAELKPAKDIEFHANPLVYATYAGDLETVRTLLDQGVSATQPMMLAGMVPMSPVTAAIHFDETSILREYLKRGVDPNLIDDVPLLSTAALTNRAGVTKLLLDAGADPARKDKYGWTPLRHSRSIEHDRPVVDRMIEDALKRVEMSSMPR